ncbi:hypothetical protein HMPREF9980_07724 [Staphylococcus epidermidis NIHLM031]|nr:hypothetical protein HMPREF9980_07724 [Staphylococcus epidermidis NIHLM031]
MKKWNKYRIYIDIVDMNVATPIFIDSIRGINEEKKR